MLATRWAGRSFGARPHPRSWMAAPKSRRLNTVTTALREAVRFAVVGDVHEKWSNDTDGAALRALGVDRAIFVGDIGNSENLGLVSQIAHLDFPKSVILGNHDAWRELVARKPSDMPNRARVTAAPADELRAHQAAGGGGASGSGGGRTLVGQQLDALGCDHIGYRAVELQGTGVTVVGGRPFSKGGDCWQQIAPFMLSMCGVESVEDSAARIAAAARPAGRRGDALVVVAHNGPLGLGSQRHDICGVDWRRELGDHGDEDLRGALDAMRDEGHPAAAVVFGHMHNTLRGGGYRRMVHVDPTTGTTYLNSATVPRVVGGGAPGATLHHFLVFEVAGRAVEAAKDVWVRVQRQQPAAGKRQMAAGKRQPQADQQQQQQQGAEEEQEELVVEVATEHEVLRTVRGEDGGVVRVAWDAHAQRWDHIVVAREQPAAAGGGGSGGGGGSSSSSSSAGEASGGRGGNSRARRKQAAGGGVEGARSAAAVSATIGERKR